jgi:carbonic anhydrase
MDARIDTNELVGDTRHYYYVIRTAGSVMSEREQEMLELAVRNGVKVIVLTTHSDCAAEKTAADPAARQEFQALAGAVDERERRVEEFLLRPRIATAVAEGRLMVRRAGIETLTDRLEDL